MTQPDIDSRLAVQEALLVEHSKKSEHFQEEMKDFQKETRMLLKEISTSLSSLEGRFDKRYIQRSEFAAVSIFLTFIALLSGFGKKVLATFTQ